jgi:hypothetical protein
MNFTREKLRVTLWILGLGTLIAWAWHGWQGWGLGRGYPFNTYLYVPKVRFSDWISMVAVGHSADPYTLPLVFYFPATYPIMRVMGWMGNQPSLWFYLLTAIGGALVLQWRVLRDVVPGWVARACAVAILAIGSYPFVFCCDRGNMEIWMALLVGGALLFCRRLQFWPATALISVTILLKLYPILLLTLFFRRRHWRYIVVPGAACFLLGVLSLASFTSPISGSLALWKQNMTVYNFLYVIGNGGLAGSACPWNEMKIFLLSADHFGLIKLQSAVIPVIGDHYAPVLIWLSPIYSELFIAGMLAVVAFSALFEREFFRRAILLLLVVTMTAQVGADYKLIWVHVALLVAILLPTRRRFDLAAVILMALVLVPKKEIYLTYLGKSDSHYADISFGVAINSGLILAALTLLMIDAWRERLPGWWWQRFKGQLHQLMDFTPLRERWKSYGVPEADTQ